MEEREEEKKLLVSRIRFGSFKLLNIDAETLFYIEKGEMNS